MKYKSCKDIENSLYIAPNEIRSCCQRFFFKGKMRGDASLIDIKDGTTPTAEDIRNARENLFNKIQKDESDSCLGCPFLYETEKPNFTHNINHLSIEHHSYCNLRCSYCSEIYYGGKRSKYNVVEFIKYLSDSKAFKNCKQVVWGGGEPTLDKSFELIVNEIDKYANPNIYHRVFTNSVRYHQAVTDFLKRDLIKIVTSIDAGTQEKFKKIRGRDKFYNVFKNLQKYSSYNPNRVTIKYIFTDENLDESELRKFVKNCLKYNLEKCNFQISMNYKNENLELKYLKSIAYLMGYLKKNNINKFFCDDHIAARFKKLSKEKKLILINYLKDKNFYNIIISKKNLQNLNVYGAGDIAENLLSKSSVIAKEYNIKLYDSDPNKIGSYLNGIKIENPDEILKNTNKIFISVAQSYDEIYSYLTKLKINTNRIVSGLFI
jgi:molybdenum cofactor biosynthesis enzyme MoaA